MASSKHVDEGGQVQLMEADLIEEEECFEPIDKLISHGIKRGDVKKLQDAGIYTCNGVVMHTKKSLTEIKGLSEAKVENIYKAAEKLLSQGFMAGNDLLTKGTTPFSSPSTGDPRGVAKQSGEGHMTASAVAEACVGEAFPQPLPSAILDTLKPFARLVRLLGRRFYRGVAIKNSEVMNDCNDNCGLAVIVLDNLTRYAWVHEKRLAKLLKVKEKHMLLLLQFLQNEKLLKREIYKRTQVKIDNATAPAASGAQDHQIIGENEYETLSMHTGSYCCSVAWITHRLFS